TVNYSKNGVAQSQLTLTTDASGNLIMPNLGAGVYSNIVLVVLGQGSSSNSAPADPITLSSPCAPTAYAVTGGTNCGSTTVGVANSQSGVTYTLKLNGVNQVPTVAG